MNIDKYNILTCAHVLLLCVTVNRHVRNVQMVVLVAIYILCYLKSLEYLLMFVFWNSASNAWTLMLLCYCLSTVTNSNAFILYLFLQPVGVAYFYHVSGKTFTLWDPRILYFFRTGLLSTYALAKNGFSSIKAVTDKDSE